MNRILFYLFSACLGSLCLCGSAAFSASPNLDLITPRGGQRGTDVTLTFRGTRLADASEVFVYYPGITISNLEVVNATTVKATAKIAPDCRLGEHAFRLRCASGISEMRTFWVGALPAVEKQKPNHDFNAPQKIPLNVTVQGVVENETVDHYAVELKKGQRLSVEIEGMRLGSTLFDPFIAILDTRRFELATCDDCALLGQDACASIIAPADGTYIIQVRDSAYGGNASCHYRLHVGTFPRPTAILPAGGKLGEEIEVTFLGDPAGPIKQKVKLPDSMPSEPFALFAQDAGGISPSGIKFRLSEFGNVSQAASGGDKVPQAAALPVAFNGIIQKPGAVGSFRFKARKGQQLDFHCYARRLGSELDSVMTLATAAGKVLISNDDTNGPDSYFRFAIPEDGEYVVRVHDHLKKGGPTYFYRIEITPVKPRLTVTVPKVDLFGYSQERQTIPVHRGNRWAVLMLANRAGVGGDLIPGAEGLPQGVILHADTLPANQNRIPLVFEAKADAPIAGTLGQLTAKTANPKNNLTGTFEQTVFLVAVPNQGVYWKHDLTRTAFAVAEEAPFKIDVIEPKVPLVQNGSMQLKVVAQRKAPFKGPINVYPLYNPPGVGSANSVTIPAGQTEAYLTINANAKAQVRKWKTVLIARADAGKGPMWVSSQLFTLEVAAPFVTVKMDRGAVEQGKSTQLVCKVTTAKPFTGEASVKLVGIPANVTAAEQKITKDATEFVIDVTTQKNAPAGTHKNIICQVVITMNGEPIVHNAGTSELRIDVPLPAKAGQPPLKAAAKPTPNQQPARRLSRLEQLRREQEEREKAAKQGDGKK